MPFLLSVTGPDKVPQEDIERRRGKRLSRKTEINPALAITSKKQKKKEEAGLTDPIRACEACKVSRGMPSLISQDWLCAHCIELEQAEQIRLNAEEGRWF